MSGIVSSKQVKIAYGSVLVGGATGQGTAVTGTSGQTLVVDANGRFVVADLTAAQVVASPIVGTNVDGLTVEDQMTQIAETHGFRLVGTANPTGDYDSADTATLGVTFKIGDQVINTTTDAIYEATDVTVGAAVWKRLDTSGGVAQRARYVHVGASEAVTYTAVGFFAAGTPLANSETVYFGSLKLDWQVDYTIAGQDLVLDLVAIGYPLGADDVVSATYTV